MATLQSIQAKIAKLQAEAEAIVKKQSTKVIAEIHALMSEHGITMEDIGYASGGKKRGTKMASKSTSAAGASNAKYRDPKSGATWSGHGRAPGWIANEKNRDKFLIDGSVTSNLTARNKAGANSAKAGNYVRGPQPAKYRDPKSGATWSGRGKPPAWLAGARDRTKFLIDGAPADALNAKESASKAATAKKAAAKKAISTVAAKKGAAKKASATPAKKSASKSAAAKKSTTAAKKGPPVGSKKAAAKKVATTGAVRAATAERAAHSTPLHPAASTSEVDAVA